MAKKGNKKAKVKAKSKTQSKSKSQSLLNNKILINIIMDKVSKRRSGARKGKATAVSKKTEPKVEQSPAPSQMQNQLAYINNLSFMNRVQPRMFLANNMQDRIDYKTQESIENGDIRERIKMIAEAQSLQNHQLTQLGQGMVMNQNDMRAMMQNNSISPVATGAHPVQPQLQPHISTTEYVPAADLATGDALDSSEEEANGDTAPGNVTQQAIGLGEFVY